MMGENDIGKHIVDCAVKIHIATGPGLLESVYESILAYELKARNLQVKRQVLVPLIYKDIRLDEGFRADIVVENKVIVELKSVEKVMNSHKKQVLTYLKMTNLKLGYLLNFGEEKMVDGITRIVNGYLD